MAGGGAPNDRWLELARIPAPVSKHLVWRALLDKTEHPERYNPAIRGAEVLDHDPTTVLRRTIPTAGAPFAEYVRHAIRVRRVEYQRYGTRWCTAQALIETEEGPQLVYEVCGAAEARAHAGIDAAHARRTLEHLLRACTAAAPDGSAANGNGRRNGSARPAAPA